MNRLCFYLLFSNTTVKYDAYLRYINYAQYDKKFLNELVLYFTLFRVLYTDVSSIGSHRKFSKKCKNRKTLKKEFFYIKHFNK